MRRTLLIHIFILALYISTSLGQSDFESHTDSRSSSASDLHNKLSVPDSSLLDKARKLVDEVFKDEFAKAKKPTEMQTLAKEIFQKGNECKDGPATQFILLSRARDLAAQAGDDSLAFQAVDELDRTFEIDAMAMKVELFKTLGKAARTSDTHKSLAALALDLLDKTRSSDRFDLTEEIAKFTAIEAAKSKDKDLVQQVQACRKDLDNAKKTFSQIETANETIKNDPNDPDANLTLGRYLCFALADWKEGLHYLAKGSDKNLLKLAAEEQNHPADADAQIALADNWWDQAQSVQNHVKENIMRHAGQWYEKALPALSGLVKYKVEKRLTQIKQLDGDVTVNGQDTSSPASKTSSSGTIPKNITTELRLDRVHGPYKMADAVLVAPTGKLLLERGTIVLCSPGANIIVQGEIGSYGEGERFVVFRREIQDKSWNAIAFPQKNKRIVFERFDIRGADFAIYVDRTPLEAKDCIFAQNTCGIKIYHKKEKEQNFRNCLIVNNLKDGIQLDSSSINIDHCTIANNGEAGLHLPFYGSAFIKSSDISGNTTGIKSLADDSDVEMHSCNILNNTVAIDITAKQKFKCDNNYWGTVDQRQILASFLDGRTKTDFGTLIFEPFEKQSIPEVGCKFKLTQ